MTFLVRPGGSRIVQLTGPPEAVSVIVPAAGGTTSIVVGRTLRVLGAGAVVAIADGDADAEGRGCAPVSLGAGWLPPTPALGLKELPTPGVAVPPATGPAPPVAPAVPPPAGRAAWCGGVATTVTANVTAAAVPAAAPTCTGRGCHHHCVLGGWRDLGKPWCPNVYVVRATAARCAAAAGEFPVATRRTWSRSPAGGARADFVGGGGGGAGGSQRRRGGGRPPGDPRRHYSPAPPLGADRTPLD